MVARIINSRALELTIISGESLSLVGKRPVNKNTFVVIKTESNNDQLATKMDTENGLWPSWNEKFFIDMPMDVNFFTLEVHYKDTTGDGLIGSARVPVTDFTGDCFPSNYLHFLSYRLKDINGERNGIINLSVKMKSSDNFSGIGTSTAYSLPAATGWNYGAKISQGVSHGVVIGVPVQNRY